VEAARSTVKAAVLKGDPGCPNVVAYSVYDTKPVHVVSTACTNLKWREREKLIYDMLWAEIINEYNNGMNHIDISDQLRNAYHFDHWIHKWKWW